VGQPIGRENWNPPPLFFFFFHCSRDRHNDAPVFPPPLPPGTFHRPGPCSSPLFTFAEAACDHCYRPPKKVFLPYALPPFLSAWSTSPVCTCPAGSLFPPSRCWTAQFMGFLVPLLLVPLSHPLHFFRSHCLVPAGSFDPCLSSFPLSFQFPLSCLCLPWPRAQATQSLLLSRISAGRPGISIFLLVVPLPTCQGVT